jgi:hypothetical protein
MPSEIIQCNKWWQGAEFLLEPEPSWLESIVTIDPNIPAYKGKFKKVHSVNIVTTNENPFIKLVNESSRLFTTKVKMGLIRRLLFNSKAKKQGQVLRTKPIGVDELQDPEVTLSRLVQIQQFPIEFKCLTGHNAVSRDSNVKNLDSIWDEDNQIIRVKTSHTTLDRPVTKLVILPIEINEQTGRPQYVNAY